MNDDKGPFPIYYDTATEMLVGLLRAGAFIASLDSVTGCTSIPEARVEYRDGVLVACVDVSENKEDKCYKVEDETLPPKGTVTPE